MGGTSMSVWTETEGTFKSWDGTELFSRTWKPKIPSDKAVIIIHRGHEHSGRVGQQVEDLELTDFWAFSWDNRGHGKSPGTRGTPIVTTTLSKILILSPIIFLKITPSRWRT